MSRRLTAVDVCAITNYSRDELHAVLKVLWPYNEERSTPRVAREFTPKDLIVLSVTQVLENTLGLRRTAVGTLGAALQDALAGPRSVDRDSRLMVTISPPSVVYLESDVECSQGIVVALGPIFERVDSHLNFGGQLQLQFGPGLVRKVA